MARTLHEAPVATAAAANPAHDTTYVQLGHGARLPVFSGRAEEDLDDWWQRVMETLPVAGITADEKDKAAAAIQLALSGAARAVFRTLAPAIRKSPDEILAALKDAFGPLDGNDTQAARARLLRFRRGTLSVAEYAAQLRLLCAQAGKTKEDEMVEEFVRGLDEVTAVHLVRTGLGTFQKLQDAVVAARRADEAARYVAPTSTTSPTRPVVTAAAALSPANAPALRPPPYPAPVPGQNDVDALRAEVAALTKALHQLRTSTPLARSAQQPQQPAPAALGPARDRSQDRWTEDGQPICNFCNVPGHIARNCPRRSTRTAAQKAGQSDFQ